MSSSIWIPSSHGAVSSAVWRVNQALKEYDERLSIGRNSETGDWCVYVLKARNDYFPVLGLGREEPTDVSAVMKRIVAADTTRHASSMLKDINDHNAAIKKQFDDAAKEGDEIAAEVLEFADRKLGVNRFPKVFVGDRKGHRPGSSF